MSEPLRSGALRAYLRDERGAATIELVVWLPFFFLLFFVVVDASVFYWRYTTMWDATRDLVREVSVRRIIDRRAPTLQADMQAYINTRLSPEYDVAIADVLTPDPVVQVSTDVGNLTVFGLFGLLGSNRTISAVVRMRNEPD